MTKEEFARKSFQVDLNEGMFEDEPDIKIWDDLSQKEKESYFKEAEHYLKLPSDQWIDFDFYGV